MQIQVVVRFAESLSDSTLASSLIQAQQQILPLRLPASVDQNHENKRIASFALPSQIDADFIQGAGSELLKSCENNNSPDCDQMMNEVASRDELGRYDSEF